MCFKIRKTSFGYDLSTHFFAQVEFAEENGHVVEALEVADRLEVNGNRPQHSKGLYKQRLLPRNYEFRKGPARLGHFEASVVGFDRVLAEGKVDAVESDGWP